MVKISFLGSCREVGRSGILIEAKSGAKLILDYGIGFNGEERLPLDADINDLKAIALTHCHIDHSGALPYLYRNAKVPFFTNPVSLAITEALIRDMIKISDFPYPFGFKELNKLMQNACFLKNGMREKIDDSFYMTFIDAGHIPGSVSILIEVDDKRILYTGDINTQKTRLINPTDASIIPEIDALIVESTYALREHPSREELEEKFVEKIIDITENGGKVLIPAFGVARSQETLLILHERNYRGKIFLDGMSKDISQIYLEHPEYLKDINLYRNALKRTQFVSRKGGRSFAKKSNGVIIAPSGMLKGGAAIEYIETVLNDPFSAVYLVGYQIEGSPGRGLLENGIFEFQENDRRNNLFKHIKIEAKCKYEYYEFSSHSDKTHLYQYIENLKFNNGVKYVFCVHGDSKSTTTLSSELAKKNYNSVAPEIGEIYTI